MNWCVRVIAYHVLDTKNTAVIDTERVAALFPRLNPDPVFPDKEEMVEDAGLYEREEFGHSSTARHNAPSVRETKRWPVAGREMPEQNSQLVSNAFLPDKLIGSDLLSLVTSGIHTAPLSIYREYIQNAADSIAASGAPDAGKVEINIDPANRRVTILDNGLGLSRVQALQELTPVASSSKRIGVDRGFQGHRQTIRTGFQRFSHFPHPSARRRPRYFCPLGRRGFKKKGGNRFVRGATHCGMRQR